MAKPKDKDKNTGGTIALNKRARHEYHIDQRFEAGLELQGWEVKSLRAGRINFGDSYAMVIKNEIFLVGTSIPPLISASTHVVANDRRTRKDYRNSQGRVNYRQSCANDRRRRRRSPFW